MSVEKVVAEFGFSTLDEYLSSDYWRSVKGHVLRRDGSRCRVCDAEATHVVDIDINRASLTGISTSALFSLCEKCLRSVCRGDESKNKAAQRELRLQSLAGLRRRSLRRMIGWNNEMDAICRPPRQVPLGAMPPSLRRIDLDRKAHQRRGYFWRKHRRRRKAA